MKTLTSLSLTLIALAALAGCDKSTPDAEPAESAVETPAAEPEAANEAPVVATETPMAATEDEAEGQFSEGGDQTKLAPIALDPFTVDSLHIGELSKGHFNLYIKGGEPAIVRAWIGDEAATNVFIAKAEFEVDHHCAHIEVPSPLPADAKLWVEIETADGTSLKGSTEVQ
jgi:hypothetical protein